MPSFSLAKQDGLDTLVHLPRQSIGGQELYPTLEEKAAIIFYKIGKSQIFANENKRMSTASLIVFLITNGKELIITPDELTGKALWLAKTEATDFQEIKKELIEWIRSNTRDLPPDSPL